MSIQEKIERLVEERKAEAAKKNLSKKMRLIVTVLGQAIRAGGAGGFGEGGLSYVGSEAVGDWADYEVDDDGALPTADYDEASRTVLHHFDGLSSGINMQIMHDPSTETIRATYDGVQVYLERQGNLECYAPAPKWESYLESLFNAAEPRAKLKEEREKADKQTKDKRTKNRVLDYLRQAWGI